MTASGFSSFSPLIKWRLPIFRETGHPAMWPAEVLQKSKMGQTLASICSKAGSKCLDCNKGRHYKTHFLFLPSLALTVIREPQANAICWKNFLWTPVWILQELDAFPWPVVNSMVSFKDKLGTEHRSPLPPPKVLESWKQCWEVFWRRLIEIRRWLVFVFALMGWSLLPNVVRPFKIYCAPPNLGITSTWKYRLNFAQRPIFSGLRFFNEPEISDPGPPGPSRRIFTFWKKSIDLSRIWTREPWISRRSC